VKTPNISFSADYWRIRGTSVTEKNENVQYGVQINQKITPQIDVWGGTGYNSYDYDANPNLNVGHRIDDWARSYFVGAQYKPTKYLSIMADMNFEHGSFYNSINNNLNNNTQPSSGLTSYSRERRNDESEADNNNSITSLTDGIDRGICRRIEQTSQP